MTRDYDMIRESFTKKTLKIDIRGGDETYISRSYKQYNPAYFEEVLLNEAVEDRVAMNYRERFLIDQEAIFQVLQMYSKMDYLEHFLKVDIKALCQAQIQQLF